MVSDCMICKLEQLIKQIIRILQIISLFFLSAFDKLEHGKMFFVWGFLDAVSQETYSVFYNANKRVNLGISSSYFLKEYVYSKDKPGDYKFTKWLEQLLQTQCIHSV